MNEYSFIINAHYLIEEVIMPKKIRSAAVIGSGIMGGGIAALLAGAGIKTVLLDIVPPDLKKEERSKPLARNRIVKAGLDAARTDHHRQSGR
jgi:3-hydroxyacyl-CoA dehydrogenase